MEKDKKPQPSEVSSSQDLQSEVSQDSESPGMQVARLLQGRPDPSKIPLTPANIVALQRTVGNKAVQRLIKEQQKSPATASTNVARKYVDKDTLNLKTPKVVDNEYQNNYLTVHETGEQTPVKSKGLGQESVGDTLLGTRTTNIRNVTETTGKESNTKIVNQGRSESHFKTYDNDPTHTKLTNKSEGTTTTKTNTKERNKRDDVLAQGVTVGKASGSSIKVVESSGTGSNAKTKTNDEFKGKEGNANLSGKVDMNAATAKGGVDFFAGERKKETTVKGTPETLTVGNKVQLGLDTIESLGGDKDFVVNKLGVKAAEKLYKEKKITDTTKTLGTKSQKTQVNTAEGAEILFDLRQNFAAAANEQTTQTRQQLVADTSAKLRSIGDKKALVVQLTETVDAAKVANLIKWLDSADTNVEPQILASEMSLVLEAHPGLLTKAGKSRETFSSTTMPFGAQNESGYSYKTTPVSAEVGFSTDSKAGYYNKTEHVTRGNIGNAETENTFGTELMAGARHQADLNAKVGVAGANLGISGATLLGEQDAVTNNSSVTSQDKDKKFENKFKTRGVLGLFSETNLKASINAQGINLGFDNNIIAGHERQFGDAAEFSYKGHKIFSLRPILRASAGFGKRASAKLSYSWGGNLLMSLELGITTGVGGSAGFEVELNFKEIAAILHSQALGLVENAWGRAKAKVKNWKWVKSLLGDKDKPIAQPEKPIAQLEATAQDIKAVKDLVDQVPAKLAPIREVAAATGSAEAVSVIDKVDSIATKFSASLAEASEKTQDVKSSTAESENGKKAAQGLSKRRLTNTLV